MTFIYIVDFYFHPCNYYWTVEREVAVKACALSGWLGATSMVTEVSANYWVARGLSSCTGIKCTSYMECL